MEVAVGLGQFDIHAGLDGKSARLLLVLCDKVAVRVGAIAQFPDGIVIGDGKSLEAHSFLSTSRMSQMFAWEGTPSTSLYEGMTLMAPAFWIASLKGNKNVSRKTRID